MRTLEAEDDLMRRAVWRGLPAVLGPPRRPTGPKIDVPLITLISSYQRASLVHQHLYVPLVCLSMQKELRQLNLSAE